MDSDGKRTGGFVDDVDVSSDLRRSLCEQICSVSHMTPDQLTFR